jgi:hypothetical protein
MAYYTIKHNLDASLDIWRYMSIEKFALLMSRRRLWFTRADLLGDEHEGSLPDSIIEERSQRLKNHRVKERIERGSKEGRKHAFLSCWSMQAPEVLSMWKIYTPNATGVSVKTTIGRLAGCVVSNPNDLFHARILRIEKVSYIDFVSHNAVPDAFDPFAHKQEAYSYEKEIRAILSYMPTVDEPPIGIEIEVDLDILVDQIYVSHCLGDGLELLVGDLLLENHMKKTIAHPPFVRVPKY